MIKCQNWYKTRTFYLPAMLREINDSGYLFDKFTDKSRTIKFECKIIHKFWEQIRERLDFGHNIIKSTKSAASWHFLTQSTKVDEQNSLISWKITSRHDSQEFWSDWRDDAADLDPKQWRWWRWWWWWWRWARFLWSPGAMFDFLVGAPIPRWSWSTLVCGWSIHSSKEWTSWER